MKTTYLVVNVSYGIHPILSLAPKTFTKKAALALLSHMVRESKADYRRRYPRGIGLTVERWNTGARLTFGVNLWESWAIEKN